MNLADGPTFDLSQRRRARRLAVWNAAVWAIGNGLASTTLVVYLAKELHAERPGLSIGLLVAMPQIVGLLRIVTPLLIDRLGGRKRFCLTTFLLSGLLLLVLPWVCMPNRLPLPGWSLAALILLWCLYHLICYPDRPAKTAAPSCFAQIDCQGPPFLISTRQEPEIAIRCLPVDSYIKSDSHRAIHAPDGI